MGTLEPVRGVNTADHDTRAYLRALTSRLHPDLDARKQQQQKAGGEAAPAADEAEDVPDAEAARMLADRALGELTSHEVPTLCDRVCSRCVELLVPAASPEALRILVEGLEAEVPELGQAQRRAGLGRLAIHSAGSHALEAIIATLGDRVLARKADESAECEALLRHIVQCLSVHTTTLMADTYGSRVVRAILRILAGKVGDLDVKIQEKTMGLTWNARQSVHGANTGGARAVATVSPPAGLLVLLREFINALCDVDLPAACWNVSASPVLQVVLECIPLAEGALDGSGQLSAILPVDEVIRRTLLHDGEDKKAAEDHVVQLVGDQVGSHWLPMAFQAASSALFAEIYSRHFRTHTATMARDRHGNYVVQGLLAHAKDAVQWGMVFDELVDVLSEWIPADSDSPGPDAAALGVLSAMASSSERWSQGRGGDAGVRRQVQLWRILKTSRTEVVEEAWTKWRNSQAAACSLVTSLCRFRLPEQIAADLGLPQADFVNAIKKLGRTPATQDQDEESATNVAPLAELLTKAGLHVVATLEAAVELFSIDERDAVAKVFSRKPQNVALNSVAVQLASATSAGSKLVQHVYNHSSVNAKRSIATTLGDAAAARSSDNKLTTTRHGRLCLQNCRVQQFEQQEESWEQQEEANQRKRKMFQDILEDDEDPSPAGKKKGKRAKHEQNDEIDDMFQKLE